MQNLGTCRSDEESRTKNKKIGYIRKHLYGVVLLRQVVAGNGTSKHLV